MQFRERKRSGEDGQGLPFIKLKDGESITGNFAGNPVEFYQHWVNNRSFVCSGQHGCQYCGQGHKASFRFRINLIVREDKALVAKVFEQGGTVYDDLTDMNSEYGGLEKVPVKITRKGEGKETRYKLLPQPAMTPKQVAVLAKVPLVDLAPAPREDEAAPDEEREAAMAEEGLPF